MATVVLSAAGHAVGAALGGNIFGLSTAVLGRAVGASVGRSIDERVLGRGSGAVAGDQAVRFRVQGAGEGSALQRIFGRTRIAGHVFWASGFEYSDGASGSGKGGSAGGSGSERRYTVSLAIGLCEGEITRVGRVWADGREIARTDLNMRVYHGSAQQMPDSKIEAVEGTGTVPGYRGTAFVVIEDLDLGVFGNRVPQFNFEVTRPARAGSDAEQFDPSRSIRAVALIPGTGEYSLSTTPVHYEKGVGQNVTANMNNPSGLTDFAASVDALAEELPNCGSASLVVSWFGDDLRCGSAQIKPKVEQSAHDGEGMPWMVSGTLRGDADIIPTVSGGVVYGGTPSDQAVAEALAELQAKGLKTLFYPFVLMDQLARNNLIDPWTGQTGQPALPWRGRITTSLALGVGGSTDGTAVAEAEVAAFFGTAAGSDFVWNGETVVYSGPGEWSYRRMILHYAHLCAAVGGVDAFCIGSEMRSLTQIRGSNNSFPAVKALCTLLDDVRQILGPGVKLGYAADWSEYFGYHPQDGSGDVYFHIDALWAHPELDFIGIDNYMPLSDWRDGPDHADAKWPSIYDLDYLRSNIEGGEGYDWYYPHAAAEAAQNRSPITDGAYGEDWVFRYKDIRNWWQSFHYERIGGVRAVNETAWVPQSKPFWFTEIGCAAIDKGTNQPNKFLDPKSSESSLPKYSNGKRDDLIQMQYLAAVQSYWRDPARNPVSGQFAGTMVDTDRMYVWAWDTRPYPSFPQQDDVWADSGNYARGHWLNGRSSHRALSDVIAEICGDAGVENLDLSAIYGAVRGYSSDGRRSGREALQPLLLAYGIDVAQKEGRLTFRHRDRLLPIIIEPHEFLEGTGNPTISRIPSLEGARRVNVEYVRDIGDFELAVASAVAPDATDAEADTASVSLCLTAPEAQNIAHRWLGEGRIAQDALSAALPISRCDLGPGDVIQVQGPGLGRTYRIDRVAFGNGLEVEATRTDPNAYVTRDYPDRTSKPRPFVPRVPVSPFFLDLPLMDGDEVAHAPFVAVTADRWPGPVAVFGSSSGSGYNLEARVDRCATIGISQTAMPAALPGAWDRSPALRVRLVSGALRSVPAHDVLNGANMAAIGTGLNDDWEIFQFADATLVDTDTFELSTRIRGLHGTDALRASWPVGSTFILLDGAPVQLGLQMAQRALHRTYLIGAANRPYSDPSYVHRSESFRGNGLRPLSPVHLAATKAPDGSVNIGWIRRTRIDGDNWTAFDVPLGEEAELYLVEILAGGVLVRSATTTYPGFVYSAAMQQADQIAGVIEIQVAEVSATFGPGLFQRIIFNV